MRLEGNEVEEEEKSNTNWMLVVAILAMVVFLIVVILVIVSRLKSNDSKVKTADIELTKIKPYEARRLQVQRLKPQPAKIKL